jgi:SAM-dependent methyltransferase
VDRATTEQLREWYSNDEKLNIEDILDVDYVWGEHSLCEATKSSESFDYCVASHVIEHIPDLVSWLQEIASILKTGGVACFVVPDKRFTFDYLRSITNIADILENYLRKIRKPSNRQIFDHFSNFVEIDIEKIWSGKIDQKRLKPLYDQRMAYGSCLDAIKNDRYVDSHCSVFTHFSFIDLLSSLSDLGLLDFRMKNFFGVAEGSFEFVVQLEKLDSSLDQESKKRIFFDSLEQLLMEIRMDFQSTCPCNSKMYYALGDGQFDEMHTVTNLYSTSNYPAQMRFLLPNRQGIHIRFDPTNHAADCILSEVRLLRNGNESVLDLNRFKPLNDIESLSITDGMLYVKAKNDGCDPSLSVSL